MRGQVDLYANARRLVQAPVTLMRTYGLHQPLATHFRRARCAEVQCDNWRSGWTMGYDLTDPDRRTAARWIRDKSKRAYTYELLDDGRRIVFTFKAGQDCFERHHLPLERDPIMVVRAGDFRGNPTGYRAVERRPEIFLERWSDDSDKLHTKRERG